jgi:hypothetical protein
MHKTSDVYFASALLSKNYKLCEVDRTDPRHMVFFFDYGDKSNLGQVHDSVLQENIDTIETQWVNRSLQVNAFDFAEAIKRMKSLIHSQ